MRDDRTNYRLCGRCRKSSFKLESGFTKPVFRCVGCDHSWSYGYDGGEYFAHAANVGGTRPIDWVEAKDIYAERFVENRT